MTQTFKTTKILPGLYRVSVKGTSRTVTLDHVTKAEGLDFDGWMVRADWNQSLCGEVCRTKAEAIEEARHLFDA